MERSGPSEASIAKGVLTVVHGACEPEHAPVFDSSNKCGQKRAAAGVIVVPRESR
jgi:hypothetical protein